MRRQKNGGSAVPPLAVGGTWLAHTRKQSWFKSRSSRESARVEKQRGGVESYSVASPAHAKNSSVTVLTVARIDLQKIEVSLVKLIICYLVSCGYGWDEERFSIYSSINSDKLVPSNIYLRCILSFCRVYWPCVCLYYAPPRISYKYINI